MRRVRLKRPKRDPEAVARGKRLFDLRCERKMSQTQVAAAADLSVPCVCKMENGDASPTLKTLSKIASAFGVSMSYLLGESADAK